MFKFAIILIMAFIAVSICAYASPIRHCSADVGTNGVSNGAGAEPGLAVGGVSSCSFSEWVNKEPCSKPVDENAEKMILREQWARNIGVDIFYPYFKAKELESKVKEKTSVRVFKLKGKPEFKSNEAKYTFTIKF